MPAAHGVLMMGKVNSHIANKVTINDQQQNSFTVSVKARPGLLQFDTKHMDVLVVWSTVSAVMSIVFGKAPVSPA